MSTSPFTELFKPTGNDRITLGTLGYVRARNRQRAYSLIIGLFKKSGLTQVELAKRLGKGTDVICRLLSRPGNWELDTFSDLLFGISGSLASFNAPQPLMAAVTANRKTETKEIGKLVAMSQLHNKPSFQSQPTAESSTQESQHTESVQLVLPHGNSMVDVFDVAA